MTAKQKIGVILFFVVFALSFYLASGLEEGIYSEKLNIQQNQSGTYEWDVKNSGEISSIKASGSVSSNGTAKVYLEKNGTRYLLFDSTRQLFDVNIQVLPDYKQILQGGEILVEISIINVRGFGAGNVNVKYSVVDSQGNFAATQQESVFVETRAKFVRQLVMPAEIRPGIYTAIVEVFTDIPVGTGSDTFEVKSQFVQEEFKPDFSRYIFLAAIVLALIIVFILVVHLSRILSKKRKIDNLKAQLPSEKIEKLGKELKSLNESYKAGYTSKKTYQKEAKRIKERLRILRRR